LYQIETASLKRRNFKFKYRNKRLRTTKIEKAENGRLKVFVAPLNDGLLDINYNTYDPKLFSVTIKNIRDVFGYEIYSPQMIKGNQFREFFVQSVNTNRDIPKDINLMNLNLPIANSEMNSNSDMQQYWVNTPLKN
ncbi:MAG: hypothetical protein AAGH46_06200, partial [Bacteroidota bacterium]